MRICRNQITDTIRDLFGANPLRIPEARLLPLSVLLIQNGRSQFMGQFRHLVQGRFEVDIPLHETALPAVTNVRSASIDLGLGIEILGNFLKGFGLNPASASNILRSTNSVGFSFSSVTRRYLEPLHFGRILSQQQIVANSTNMFLDPGRRHRRRKLALVTDVIRSSDFTLHVQNAKGVDMALDADTVLDQLGPTDVKLDVQTVDAHAIRFQHPEPLTFAFSCVELEIGDDGAIRAGQWIHRTRGSGMPSSMTPVTHLHIDDASGQEGTLMLDISPFE